MNYADSIQQFSKSLRQLDQWLAKAITYAESKKFDPNVLASSRLAADMFPLTKQVQSACDAAKFAAAYYSGKQPPTHPDTEQTLPELRTRIATCLAYLDTVSPADLEGADQRKISPPWLHGKWLTPNHYMWQLSIPNFYFHITTAYNILRHNGVDIGKMDFIGNLSLKD